MQKIDAVTTSNSDGSNIRKSSVNALKTIYYVIIGLAITEALHRTFVRDGAFIGLDCFRENGLPTFFLLCAFLCTVCRFVHGASLHLDRGLEKHLKPLFDFIAFFIQASFFYLMALSLDKPRIFSSLFGLMLLSDATWLILLRIKNYIEEPYKTANQWLLSDCIIIIALFLVYKVDTTMASIWSAVAVLTVAAIATFLDYYCNKHFYFPGSNCD